MPCSPAGAAALGQAIATMNQCPALPPARNWFRTDLVDSSRSGIGQQVQVRLDGVPVTDSKGRFAHVRGIYLQAIAQFTQQAGAPAYPAYQLRSIWQSMYLKDLTGHGFWDNLDGRTLLDDQFFRHGTMLQYPYLHFGVQGSYPEITDDNGLPASINGGVAQVDVGLYCPLVTLGGKNMMQGLIPVASLQLAGADALRFRIRQGLPQLDPLNNFDGLFQPGGTTQGFWVWLDLVYLPEVVIDAPWKLREYTRSEQTGMLNLSNESTEYAWMRYFPEDTFGAVPPVAGNGQSLVNGYDQFTLQIAGFVVAAGQTFDQFVTRHFLFQASMKEGALLDNNPARDLPLFIDPASPTFNVSALPLVPYMGRHPGAAAGPVNYEFGVRPPTQTRFVHRTFGCNRSLSDAVAIADAIDCNPCGVMGSTPNGAPSSMMRPGEPMIVATRR